MAPEGGTTKVGQALTATAPPSSRVSSLPIYRSKDQTLTLPMVPHRTLRWPTTDRTCAVLHTCFITPGVSSTPELRVAAVLQEEGAAHTYPTRPRRRTSLSCGVGHPTGETANEGGVQSPPVEKSVATKTLLRSSRQPPQTLAFGGPSSLCAAELAAGGAVGRCEPSALPFSFDQKRQ